MADNGSNQRHFPIHGVTDVVRARRSGMNIALQMGFHHAEANKIAVVISELGRNIEQYAGRGTITVIISSDRIEVVAEDQGPGIPDVDRVLAGGYTTSNGMGLGVSGSRRLMDEFEIQSTVGMGTTIKAAKRLR